MPSLFSLSGHWSQSQSQSSDITPILTLQGFNALTRSALVHAPINLSITQSSSADAQEILIEQSTTASIPALTERWYPPSATGTWSDWREDKDAVFGTMKSRSRWVKGTDFEHKEGIGYLTEGLGRLETYLEAEVECVSGGWRARQVWYVDEEGRFVRRVVVLKGEGEVETAEAKLVYEFKGDKK